MSSINTSSAQSSASSAATKSNSLRSKILPRWAPWVCAGAALALAIVVSFIAFGNVNIPVVAIAAGVLNLLMIYFWSRSVEGARQGINRVATTLVTSSFVLALVPLVSLLWMTVERGLPVLIHSTTVLTRTMNGIKGIYDQQYVAGEAALAGGFYHAIVGTVLITFVACIISIPVGVLTAIYLVEYGGKNTLAKSITLLVDVMTGIPSIVAGLFAFALFTTLSSIINPNEIGSAKTGFAAGVALSVLMIPIVVRNTEEILRLVPRGLREATYALGVPKWKTITHIVLPTAISGILSGVTIAIARVIGETAPIMVTAGFAKSLNNDLFEGWMATLPTYIYDAQMHPVSPGVAAVASSERAWAAALVLIALVMVLNLVARVMAKYLAPKGTR